MRYPFYFFILLYACCTNAQQWNSFPEKGGKLSWATPDGRGSIPPSSITSIDKNLFVKTKTGKKGAISPTGKLIIDTNYVYLEKLGDSLIVFSTRNELTVKDTLVEKKNLHFYSKPILLFPDNRFGLMDLSGKTLLPQEYSGFRTLLTDSRENYVIRYEQTVSLERQQLVLNETDDYERYRVGILSPGGKIIIDPIYSDFFWKSANLFVGQLPYDYRFYKEAYLIPQPNGTYRDGCFDVSLPQQPVQAYNYYPQLVFYNKAMKEVAHLRGRSSYSGNTVVGTDHFYYFLKGQLIDSIEITRIYDADFPSLRRTIYLNDSCGYTKEGESASSLRYKIENKLMQYGTLYSVFSEHGHCLFDQKGDTVLFSSENHFYRMEDKPEIHIRTCDKKWGLADTLGKILIPTISDSIILHTTYFSRIYQNGNEIWLNSNYESLASNKFRIWIKTDRQYNPYLPFYVVQSHETNKLGFIDSLGNTILPMDFVNIYPWKNGFVLVMKKRNGKLKKAFTINNGSSLTPVEYRKNRVSAFVKD